MLSPSLAPGVAATLVGAHLTFSFARDLMRGRASRRWPHAPGRIVAWGGHEGTRASHDSVASLTYEYAVDGRTYRSRRVDYAGRGAGAGAGAVLARYAPGAEVAVRYDPRRPARSVLEPGVGVANYLRLTVALGMLAAGLAMLAAVGAPAT